MARKLKVYAAEIDGVHEWIIAAPNQGEALAALGVHQNLFQQGLARPADSAPSIDAALASPGVPLRRLKGSKAAFKPVEGSGAAAWEKAAKAAGVKAGPAKRPRVRSRAKLDKAQADLETFETSARRGVDNLDRQAQALQEKRAALLDERTAKRADLRAAVDQARREFAGT